MFGTSHASSEAPKDNAPADTTTTTPHKSTGPGSIPKNLTLQTDADTLKDTDSSDKRSSNSSTPEQTPSSRRRSSGISKAGALFSSAKHSLHLSSSSHPHASSAMPSSPTQQQTPMQKLGKTDPALSVPQGSLNNSAGESRPGPRSTFRVGVTEDRNRKCRRTMEDTHAYLYNFLSTPAPNIDTGSKPTDSSTTPSDEAPSSTIAETVVETDNGYFAVFDGHAGTFAADWCGKKLHVLLEDIIRKNPNSPVPELLDHTFTTVDQQLDKLPLKNSGCTAICAVLRWEDRVPNTQSATGSTAIAPAAAAVVKAVAKSDASSEKGDKDAPNGSADEARPAPQTPNMGPQMNALISSTTTSVVLPKLQETALRQRVLYTANVGDARIVLCRNGKALRLSYDHKGSDENEGKRITNAGGLILNNRVNGVLAVTRALGDTYMKDLVTGHPYTTETVIQADMDEFLILACDGLWDVCTDQEAVDLIRSIPDPQLASKTLVEHALSRFSTDNLSCMVVRFDAKSLLDARAAAEQQQQLLLQPHHHHPHAAEQLIGVEGDPPTRKKGGISEVDKIVGEAKSRLRDGAEGKGDGAAGVVVVLGGGGSSHGGGGGSGGGGGDDGGAAAAAAAAERKGSLLGIGEEAIREEEGKEGGPALAVPLERHLKGKGGK